MLCPCCGLEDFYIGFNKKTEEGECANIECKYFKGKEKKEEKPVVPVYKADRWTEKVSPTFLISSGTSFSPSTLAFESIKPYDLNEFIDTFSLRYESTRYTISKCLDHTWSIRYSQLGNDDPYEYYVNGYFKSYTDAFKHLSDKCNVDLSKAVYKS